MSHTKGPWHYADFVVRDKSDVPIASVDYGFREWSKPIEESRANARLIAAAPDLLAALERAIPEIAAVSIPDLLEQAREAIAKARGNSPS